MHDQHVIVTPEKVVVSLRLAGIGPRIIAHLLDLLIVYALYVAGTFISIALQVALGEGLAQAFLAVFMATAIFLYFILLEGLWRGQTLGKKAMRVRVMMADGTPVTLPAAIFRNLLRPADFLPAFYLVGFLSMFTNPMAQRLGDLASGTVVVHDGKTPGRFTPAPHRYGLHPFEHAVPDLRKMTLEEYFAIKRLCDRFPELAPEVQEQSVQSIWVPFAQAHGIAQIPNVHPMYVMEAVVMKYSRIHKLV